MKPITLALTFFMLGSISSGLALAESIENASQKDIAKLLDAASGLNSAYVATLIGETPDRVYIEYRTGVHASSFLSKGPKRVVYWLPRSEITDQQLMRFRIYKDEHRIVDTGQDGRPQAKTP